MHKTNKNASSKSVRLFPGNERMKLHAKPLQIKILMAGLLPPNEV